MASVRVDVEEMSAGERREHSPESLAERNDSEEGNNGA
jgi:hypothetical protein